MLNLPDLNRMKVFYAVYKYRSLVGTAEAMNITRSAVSQSLKALEGELQTKLFIRDSKRVSPTEAADLLFRSIEPFIAELQAAVSQIETGKREPSGHLRVGAPQDFGSTHLTEVIVDFRRKYPKVTFEVVLAIPTTLLEMLTEGNLDIAFVDNGDFHAKNYPVSIVTVMKEKFVLVASTKYIEDFVKRPSIKYEELKNLEFVDYIRYAPVAKMWIKHHFGKVPHELSASFSAESVRAVIRAIKGGLGVGVVPEHLVETDLKSGRLKLISAPGRDLFNQISLARRLERSPTMREKRFVEFYKEFIGQTI